MQLFLTLAAASVACAPLPGATAIVARFDVRWLLVGEPSHGTSEMPLAANDLICIAARERPVVVALEYAIKNQPMINTYLQSDGGSKAHAAFLSAPMWDRDWADGKSSRAMFGLIEWLRVQHRLGRVKGVVAFDADIATDSADREQQMAKRLRAVNPGNGGLVVILTGSFHARKQKKEGYSYAPAASLLPPRSTLSFLIRNYGSGQSWSCRNGACGVQTEGSVGRPKRGLYFQTSANRAYDGALDLGVPPSASPPMKED